MADELTFTVDGLNYQHLGGLNQAVRLLGYEGDKCPQKVIIPATVSNAGKTYSVDVISSGAFLGCVDLISVEMKSSGDNGVKYIDPNSFAGCTNLSKVGFSGVLKAIYAPGFSGQRGAFEGCTSLKTIVLPASMDYMGEVDATAPHNICKWAFKNCTGLKTVIINASRPYIEDEAFINCSSLQYFVSYNTHPWSLEWNTFQGIPSTANLIVPDGTKSTYQALLGWNAFNNIDEHSNVDLKAILGEEDQPQGGGTAKLSIQDFTIKAGETKTMLIDMQNPDDQVTLVQFDLRLPDGLSIATGNDASDIAGRTTWRKHTLTSNATNGITRFLLYSATNELIEGTSGAIISIKLTASSSFNGGDIKLENQLMTTPSLVESKPATYSYNIKGGGVTPPVGDAEAYVVYNNGTLTFYCDNQRSSRQGTVYDLNKDTKNPGWLEHKENVKKAVFDASFTNARPTTTYSWFDNCKNLSDIQGISYLNTSEVTRMEWMFRDCSSLTSIDVSGFNTSNVGPIGGLFYGCSGLTNLDLSSFNTSNVWSMSQMFNGCSNLVSLTFGSSFTTSESVTNQSVFYNCGKLNTVIFTGDIPSQMKSTFFVGVGSEKTPATLHVPDAYKTNFQAKFDGNKFFGGYFKLSGDTPAGDGEPYVVYNNGTLTFYCDNQRSSRQGTVYDLDQKSRGLPAWLENGKTITKAIFDHSFANAKPESTKSWFVDCSAMTDIEGIAYLNTDNVTYMDFMFRGCIGLTNLDVSKFNTSNVTVMNSMFDGCSGLTSLDVSHFNTSNVTDMNGMFYGCSGLTSLDVSKFNTGNVTNMSYLFDGCSSLTSIDVSNFNTSSVTSMNAMFYDCSSLTSLDVSKFNTGNVTKMRFMFSGCKNLSKLTLGNGFVSSEDLECRNFTGCSSLKTVAYTGDIPYSINSKFFEGVGTANAPVTLEVPDQYRDHYAAKFDGNMFFGGYFKLSGDNPSVSEKPYVVYNDFTLTFYCDDLRSKRSGTIYSLNEGEAEPEWVLDDNNRNVEKVVFDASFAKARPTSTFQWFFYCDYLTEIKGIENLNTSEVKTMRAMFASCKHLKSVDVSHFDTKAVLDMGAMFSSCTSLESIDVSHFDSNNVWSMVSMFNNCQSLTEINLSSFNTSNVEYLSYLFSDCSNLKTVYLGSGFVSDNSVECEEAFAGCQNLSKVVFTGDVPTDINNSFFVGVGTASKPAKLDVPEQYVANYEAKFVGNMFYGGYFTLREAIVPDEKGGKDYGSGNSEIDEKTNLDGSVIGNVYYSIAPENGGYNSAEGCLVVTKPSSDNAFEIDDPFGNDFKGMFTGIMIMVQQGSGIVKVEAESSGGMTLMVKVGNGLPIQMTMLSKSTLAIPYSVDRPTYIYIYAGGSNGNARTRASSDGKLKIYSISWESSASGINSPVGEEQLYDVYSLSGTLIKRSATSLDALPKGVYIVNGRKVVVK